MTPDQLLLPPAKVAQLAGLLASSGVADGVQAVIDEVAGQVADYTKGYSFPEARTNGWIRTLALQLAYTRAAVGVPEAIKLAGEAAIRELEAVRDGKFRTALNTSAPARDPGRLVSEASQLDSSLR